MKKEQKGEIIHELEDSIRRSQAGVVTGYQKLPTRNWSSCAISLKNRASTLASLKTHWRVARRSRLVRAFLPATWRARSL